MLHIYERHNSARDFSNGCSENALEFQSREGFTSTKHAQRAPNFSGVVIEATRCTLLLQPEVPIAS